MAPIMCLKIKKPSNDATDQLLRLKIREAFEFISTYEDGDYLYAVEISQWEEANRLIHYLVWKCLPFALISYHPPIDVAWVRFVEMERGVEKPF